MNFWEKLKGIVKIEKIVFSPKLNINLTAFSGNKKFIYNREEKRLDLNLNKIKLSELGQILEPAVIDGNYMLLEEKAKETLDDFRAVEKTRRNQRLLEYFNEKIPKEDLPILRASLYLKSVFERGNPTEGLKQDIVRKYGERGRKISNLCTAGYFETLIRPLYEIMASSPGFSHSKFLSIYNVIVEEHAFSIFVNRTMSKQKLKEDVLAKIEKNKKFGVQYLNIHGIGRDNTKKIRDLIIELKDRIGFEKELEEGENYIVVKLRFRNSTTDN